MNTIFHLGNYGNQIDGVSKPASAKKKKEGGEESEEEETELIHNSSDEEAEDDGDLTSVPSTPPMKPVITDRSEVRERKMIKWQRNIESSNCLEMVLRKHFTLLVYKSVL